VVAASGHDRRDLGPTRLFDSHRERPYPAMIPRLHPQSTTVTVPDRATTSDSARVRPAMDVFYVGFPRNRGGFGLVF